MQRIIKVMTSLKRIQYICHYLSLFILIIYLFLYGVLIPFSNWEASLILLCTVVVLVSKSVISPKERSYSNPLTGTCFLFLAISFKTSIVSGVCFLL